MIQRIKTMKNREQYKKLLSLIASLIILCLQTGIFMFVWYHCYSIYSHLLTTSSTLLF